MAMYILGFLGVSEVKNPPAMQETWVQCLEKEMATHSSILAWKIPQTEEPGGWCTVHGVAKSQTRRSDLTGE